MKKKDIDFELGKKEYDDDNISKAFEIWFDAAEKNDANSQYQIGLAYYDIIESE